MEDTPSKGVLSQFLGFEYLKTYDSFNFPFIQIEMSDTSDHIKLDGFNKIIEFLVGNNFISDFRSYSLEEKLGIDFSVNLQKCLETQFIKISNKFSFYNNAYNFVECEYGYTPHSGGGFLIKRLTDKFYRFVKASIKALPDRIKHRKILARDAFQNELSKLLEEWVIRLNNHPYHGGDLPDEADFRVYSLLKKYKKCSKIRGALSRFKCSKFSDWESKLDLLCERNENKSRSSDFAYNFNKLNANEINEEFKINGQDSTQKFHADIKGAFSGRKKRNSLNI